MDPISRFATIHFPDLQTHRQTDRQADRLTDGIGDNCVPSAYAHALWIVSEALMIRVTFICHPK